MPSSQFLPALILAALPLHGFDGHGMTCGVGLPGLRKTEASLPLTPAVPSAAHVPGTGFRIVIVPTERLAAQPEVLARMRKAAARWEAIMSNDLTVTVAADYGPDFFGAVPFPDRVLAFTDPHFADKLTLSEMQNVLRIGGSPLLANLWNQLPEPTVAVENGEPRSLVKPTVASAQVLLLADESAGFTADMGFSSLVAWDFDPGDGIDADRYDFDALVVHELGHALGFVTAVSTNDSDSITPLDYYRTRPGAVAQSGDLTWAVRVLAPGPGDAMQVFNAGWGEVPLSTGDDGRDPSHWRDEDLPPFQLFGIMKPTFFPHERSELAENDVLAMQAIGYSPRLPLVWSNLVLPASVDLGYVLPNRQFSVPLPIRNSSQEPGRVSVEVVSLDANGGAQMTVSPVAVSLSPGESRAVTVRVDTVQARGMHRALLRFHTNDKSQLLHDVEVRFNVSDIPDRAGWVLE